MFPRNGLNQWKNVATGFIGCVALESAVRWSILSPFGKTTCPISAVCPGNGTDDAMDEKAGDKAGQSDGCLYVCVYAFGLRVVVRYECPYVCLLYVLYTCCTLDTCVGFAVKIRQAKINQTTLVTQF